MVKQHPHEQPQAEAGEKQFKLNYKIVGKRPPTPGDVLALEHHDVIWTHADGPIKQNDGGTRDEVKDQISVPAGTAKAVIMQMLEDKRERLAQNLGVEP